MPRRPKGTPPSYRKHSSGQAVVTVRTTGGRRKDVLLGQHDTDASRSEYAAVLTRLAAHGGLWPDGAASPDAADITVNELVLAFEKEQERRRGADWAELKNYAPAFRFLKEMYGAELACRFTPRCLKAVRRRMATAGWLRSVVNRQVGRLKRLFTWAAEEELVSGNVAFALRAVRALSPGEEGAPEPPAPEVAFFADAEKVAARCPPPVAAMLKLQALTGMRSGEVRILRTLDVDRSDPNCWAYRPGSDAGPCGRHKNAWRGQQRVVFLGPRAVEVLRPWLRDEEPDAYLFSPRRWMEQQRAARAAARKSKRPPSQLARTRKPKPKRAPAEVYTRASYPQAVKRACKLVGVSFRPYALRHGAKVTIERAEGSEAARAMLGQKSIEATTHYGRLDLQRAADVMRRRG
jgi:integrase